MARVRDTLVLDKFATTDPVELIWSTAPTSGMGIVVMGAIDSNTYTLEIDGFSRLDVGATGGSGSSAIVWYKELNANAVDELTFTWIADGIIVACLVDGHDTVNMIDVASGSVLSSGTEHYTESISTISSNSLCFELFSQDGNRGARYLGDHSHVILQEGNTPLMSAANHVSTWGFAPISGSNFGNELIRSTGSDGGGVITFAIKDANPSNPTIPVFKTQSDFIPLRTDIPIAYGSLSDANDHFFEFIYNEPANPDLVVDGSLIAGGIFTATNHGYLLDDAVMYMGGTLGDIPELVVGDVYNFNRLDDDSFKVRIKSTTTNPLVSATPGDHTFRNVGFYGDNTFATIGYSANRAGTRNHVVGGGVFPSIDLTNTNLLLQTSTYLQNEMATIALHGLVVILKSSSGAWKSYTIAGSDMIADTSTTYNTIINIDYMTEIKEVGTFDETDVVGLWVGNRVKIRGSSPVTSYTRLAKMDKLVVVGGQEDIPVSFSEIEKISTTSRLVNGNYAIVESKIDIGNGIDKTYYVDPQIGISLASKADLTTDLRFQTPEGFFSFSINPSPLDYIDADKTTVCESYLETGVEPMFYNFNNKTVSAPYSCELASWQVSSGRIFDGCARVVDNGANVTSPTIKSSTDTEGALLWTNTVNFTSPTFTDNHYHIEIDTAGDYDISDHTYSGALIADINISATTGVVNLTKTTEQPTPTYVTAGATVNFVSPVTSFSLQFENIIDGSRYQFYNEDTASTLENAVISGGNGIDSTFIEGEDYTAGDIITYKIAYQETTTAKELIVGQLTAPADTATFSNPISQTDQPNYNQHSVDGSTVTQITWDNGNLHFDINDPDNSIDGKDIAAWYYYFISTDQGIDQAAGSIIWDELNKVVNCTACVPILIDNTKAAPLKITDTWIFRDDGLTIIAPLSNSVQIDPPAVFIAETGVSGLTPPESAHLFGIDTTNLDAPVSDIKERTDNLPDSPADEETLAVVNLNTAAIPSLL